MAVPMPVAPSNRTRLRRLPARGAHDRDTIDAILDEALVAHLGVAIDGSPYVVPTLHARVGDTLYVHGSAGSRTLRALASEAPACVTVTLIDGLVLARAAVHHSVNYRSVVVFGQATPVKATAERRLALQAFMERLLPGRWDEARAPNDKELRVTSILSIPLSEASAKVRTGPPLDEQNDYLLDVWAGVVPLALRAASPIPDPLLSEGIRPSAVIDGLVSRHS